jgi:hypothetical protein
MNDDELRDRLARLDPQADAPVEPVSSPWAHDLLERSMTTTETLTDAPSSPARQRRFAAGVAAGAVLVAGGAIAGVMLMGDDDKAATTAQKSTLALSAPGGGPIMGSCIMFSVDNLKREPVAFAGTVTAVEPGTVTLDVTKWFKGGTADQVTVSTHDNQTVALDGVDFEKGKSFLVSADQGNVATCGYSGPDEPQLRGAFEQAFGD